MEKFSKELDDRLSLHDLRVGRFYTTVDICTLSRRYQKTEGIHLVKDADETIKAILIKATLNNGEYPNKWIIEDRRIKYYFYKRNKKYDPANEFNKAILASNTENIPIYLFIKNEDKTILFHGTSTFYTLNGIYKYNTTGYDIPDYSTDKEYDIAIPKYFV